MGLTMPVFKIYSDSIDVIRRDIHLLAKSLILPIFCVILINLINAFLDESSPIILTLTIINCILNILILNMTTRLVINRTPELMLWKAPETKTLLYIIGFIVSVGVSAGLLTCLIVALAPRPPYSPIIESFFSLLKILTFISIFYLYGRTVLILPAIAVGQKLNLSTVIRVSKTIAWKLIAIFSLAPVIAFLFLFICMLFLPVNNDLLISAFSFLFMPVGILSTVALALAYKRAEPYLLADGVEE